MSSITLKFGLEKYEEIKEFYKDHFTDEKGDYLDFSARYEDCIIKGYTSKKDSRKVVFSGLNADIEAKRWNEQVLLFGEEKPVEEKKEEKLRFVDFGEQIGSDEVGVGDFYLPMIVVASYISKTQYQRLKELGVTDSKKLSDKKIRELGPILIKEFEYSKLTLSNQKYNEMTLKGENINSLKAKMHNRALNNLHEKYIDVIAIYVDQFVNEQKYYSYLSKNDEPILKGISFKTKGESRFPSVALASVIARYSLLLEKDKLDQKYDLDFPFGAGKAADEFKKVLLSKVGPEEFDNLVKKNFKNYSKRDNTSLK